MFLSSDFFKAALAFTFLIVFTVTLLRTDSWWKALAYPFLAVTLKRLDVPKDKADLERVNAIMATPIEWAPGLPLNADGFVADYYQKD